MKKEKNNNASIRSLRSKSTTLSLKRADGARQIREAKLVRIPNRNTHRRYTVEFSCPEFTCICPVSGFPDFATIHIKYSPRQSLVELKSLKLYINQFRNKGIFHEDVPNRILDDLIELLDPWEMEVIGDYSVRGNIKTTVRANHVRQDQLS